MLPLHHLRLISWNKFIRNASPLFHQARVNFSSDLQSEVTENGKVECILEKGLVRLQSDQWHYSLNFSPIWLRDHCRCPDCFSHSTAQRIQVTDSSWLGIQPVNINIDKNTLNLNWPDGHQTSYDLSWLRMNSYSYRLNSKWISQELWNKERFQTIATEAVNYDQLMTSEGTAARLIRSILTNGIGFVTHTPATKEATKMAAEHVCEIQKTFWSDGITITQPDEKHIDLAYGTKELLAHTDCNYLYEPPGIQVFHVLEAAKDGGETLLVDGFLAAKELKQNRPDAYETLSSVAVQFEFRNRDGQKFYKHTDKVLKHDHLTGDIFQIRFSPNDLSPISTLPPDRVPAFYEAWVEFREELLRHQASVRLAPGTVLFVDNWRVLHGRTAFTGHRAIVGAYLGRSDFLNRARILGVVNELY